MKKFYLLCFTSACMGCAPSINYLGEKYPATKKVQAFVSADRLPKEVIMIGQSQQFYSAFLNTEKMQAKAEKKAMQVGADFILLTPWYSSMPAGANVNSQTRIDSVGKSQMVFTQTQVSPTFTNGCLINYYRNKTQ